MKIQHKFALYMFFSIILFLMVFSFLTYRYSKNIAIDSAMHLMQVSVAEESGHLGSRLIEKSKIAVTIASSDTLLRELIKSNAEYEKLTDSARQTRITNLNLRWKESSEAEDLFVKSYMNNLVADSLRLQQQALPGEIGEIFVTNQYGLAIGTTNKLSTLAHSHKYWWKAANNNGKGRIFFDDRGYDESVGGYVIGIVVPIKVNNQIIGILKCNFNLLSTLNDYLRSVGHQEDRGHQDLEDHKVILLRSNGRIILGEGETPLSTSLPKNILDKLDPASSVSMILDKNNVENIVSYSPVALTFSSGEYSFGGRYRTIDDVNDDASKGWYLVFTNDIHSILSPTIESLSWFAYAGLMFAFMAGIVALFMGRHVAQPISSLTERARRIGRGHLDEVIDSETSDELGVLAKAFNNMSRNLTETQNQLIKKERLATLGQLTATVSHELRNPLGAMRPSLYIMDKNCDKNDERMTKALEVISRNISRCDHIIDELLDFTRITELELQVTQIDPWLESVIDEQVIPEGIKLEKEFSLNDIKLSIDVDRLRRAVINLVENACHAMQDDNRQVNDRENSRLNIKTQLNENRIEIIICDTGIGIAKLALDRIFEPLFSTKGFGIGLGMSAVNQIMEQHGGCVEVDTEEGEGTTVTLWLPNNPIEMDRE